jgi:hypothetical protein
MELLELAESALHDKSTRNAHEHFGLVESYVQFTPQRVSAEIGRAPKLFGCRPIQGTKWSSISTTELISLCTSFAPQKSGMLHKEKS